MIRERLELIQEIQTDEYWQDITAPMLEIVRKRLRDLIKLIEKSKRNRIYTAFLDEIGPTAEIEIVTASAEIDFERFKAKVQHFLKTHSDHIVIHKLRRNQPLTKTDLEELEKILVHAAGAPSPHLDTVKQQGLGLFIRSLIGLDREAAKAAFASFLSNRPLTGSQIEFINLIIDHLTEHGIIEPKRLYESPFTDYTPRGVEGLFDPPQVKELLKIVSTVDSNAAKASIAQYLSTGKSKLVSFEQDGLRTNWPDLLDKRAYQLRLYACRRSDPSAAQARVARGSGMDMDIIPLHDSRRH
jgi:type I restriction enzyme R subunit